MGIKKELDLTKTGGLAKQVTQRENEVEGNEKSDY